VASSRAALGFYQELAPKAAMLSIQELLRLAEEGDSAAEEAVLRQMKALGHGLRLITAALSPELILITGELTSCWKKFGPTVQKEMERTMLVGPAPRLATAGDGYLARLSGAAAMLLQRHSRYHRSTRPSRTRKQLPGRMARSAEAKRA
jgi:predicted NBD/HSP70 family sugar kinase